MTCNRSSISGIALVFALALGASAHAQERDATFAPETNNLGSSVSIAAQAARVDYDRDRDRRNAMIALGVVAVGAAVAAGAFDSSSSHEPPVIVPPPTHGS